MQRFKSPEQANDFLSAHAFIYGHFHPRRHLLAASAYRAPNRGIQCLAAGHVRLRRGMMCAAKLPRTSGCLTKVNVIMPILTSFGFTRACMLNSLTHTAIVK
jgi:hypothetical protein